MVVQLLDDFKISGVNGTRILDRLFCFLVLLLKLEIWMTRLCQWALNSGQKQSKWQVLGLPNGTCPLTSHNTCEALPESRGCNLRPTWTDGSVRSAPADKWSQSRGFSWHVNVIFILTETIFRCLHGVWGAGASLIKVDHKVQLPGITFAMCEEHHQTGNTRRSTVLLLTHHVSESLLFSESEVTQRLWKPVRADYLWDWLLSK